MNPDKAVMDFAIATAADTIAKSIHHNDPMRNVYLAMVMPHESRPAPVEEFLKSREAQMADANSIARAFRANTRQRTFPSLAALRKSGAALAKAQLDVGTLTNFAQITGGQSLGYVSLDTQMARGTVRPNSFTLYQALHKTRAFQIVDYWSYASDTGGAIPGAAFASYGSVGSGSLTTSAGKYQLQNITLKLAVDGRSITTALAAQNSFVDVAAQENTNAALTVLESVNWACYYGNPTFYATQFTGIDGQIPAANKIDYQGWYNSYAAAQGWSQAQALFNLIYQWSGQITSYNQFGRITHAFMSPQAAGSLQGLVTTLLNNVVTAITGHMDRPDGIVVNGDLQGMRTRFGEIQFPIDLYITARDKPAQAILFADGTNAASTTAPTPPQTVTVAVTGATTNSAWTTSYVAASGQYMYAAASTDANMKESTLTWATVVSGIAVGGAYRVTVTGPVAADAINFRIFRSGLGLTVSGNPAAVRFIGTIAASGAGAVVFTDLNTKIPGGEPIFLLDLDEADNALDFRYLLPLTKIELFAQNLFMPWAVAAIGSVRVKVPKFHGLINNYVGDNPDWNPLSNNANAV